MLFNAITTTFDINYLVIDLSTESITEEKPKILVIFVTKTSPTEPEFVQPKKANKRRRKETKSTNEISSALTSNENDCDENTPPNLNKEKTDNNEVTPPNMDNKKKDNPDENQETTKREKVIPVIIRDKTKWNLINRAIMNDKINYVKAKSISQGIQVELSTEDDYRKLYLLLQDLKIELTTRTS